MLDPDTRVTLSQVKEFVSCKVVSCHSSAGGWRSYIGLFVVF